MTAANSHLILHTDGGARGNPGPSGIGVQITDQAGAVVQEIAEYIGEATNNQAEYKALIRGLEEAKKLGAETLQVYMDSELIVKQIKGEYKVKNKDLAPLFVKVYNLSQTFKKVAVAHVRREQNEEADRLVNEAIDAARQTV